ncbi:MAG: glycosyltransferase family 2 protein [Deltaproteobacteria bacterium]|nr:glycosyltransferase family 2 protein [Deltaproteobacteria bacterium]
MRHIVIIPARNEAGKIERTLDSILRQEDKPDRTYVVDDGSSDSTPSIVSAFCRRDPSVILLQRKDRGFRKMGGGVVEAFNFAYERIKDETPIYISKVDADIVFEDDYFRVLLKRMDKDPTIAIGGGNLYEIVRGKLIRDRIPAHHVPGAIKTVRATAFKEMGGFLPILGWDIIDETKAHLLGYKTLNYSDLKVTHLRQHASAEGILKGKATWGRAAYLIGSHPLFVFGRGLYRMLERPYVIGGIAMWFGYIVAWSKGEPQIQDKVLKAFVRREQLQRLYSFNRLPPAERK